MSGLVHRHFDSMMPGSWQCYVLYLPWACMQFAHSGSLQRAANAPVHPTSRFLMRPQCLKLTDSCTRGLRCRFLWSTTALLGCGARRDLHVPVPEYARRTPGSLALRFSPGNVVLPLVMKSHYASGDTLPVEGKHAYISSSHYLQHMLLARICEKSEVRRW